AAVVRRAVLTSGLKRVYMCFIIIITAVLMILGLAAFGVVSAQKMSTSQATASDSSATPASQPAPAAGRRHPVNPVNQVAQTSAETAAAPSAPAAAAPIRVAQATQTTPAGAPGAARRRAKPAPAAPAIPACDKPGGMGLARIVEIDTTGGPGFGFEHFKQYDFLRDKEVVLTFDDGPWPGNTPAVLKMLADE